MKNLYNENGSYVIVIIRNEYKKIAGFNFRLETGIICDNWANNCLYLIPPYFEEQKL